MTQREIPVLLLTGYLGAGKTTLLNNILRNERGIRFAVIVNDIGEVNIDETLIRKEGIVGASGADDLVALQNGCICCTLKMDLVNQLADLVATRRFDYIVIEASGICEPAPIAQTVCSMARMTLPALRHGLPVMDCIVTVVDALRLKSEFGCGEALTVKSADDQDLSRLVIEQIEFCNIVILNKISEVTPDEAKHIRAIIHALQPKATVIETDYCDVPLDRIINTGMFNFGKVATSATWVQGIEGNLDEEEHHHDHEHHHEHEHEHDHGHEHHCSDPDHCTCGHHHHHHGEGEALEYGISTFVYQRRAPFDFHKFEKFLENWPKSVIRAKGVMYFSQNRDMSLLFEQAGVQKRVSEAGLWYATAPADELRQLMEMEPGLARDWDPEYGDRMDKIVFIGQNMDRHAITEALDACLASH